MPLAADDPRKKLANQRVAAKRKAAREDERAKKLAAPDASANREGADPEGAGNLHMTGHEGGDDPCPAQIVPDLADRLWAQKKAGVVWTAPTGDSVPDASLEWWDDNSLTQPVDAPNSDAPNSAERVSLALSPFHRPPCRSGKTGPHLPFLRFLR